MDLSIVVPCRGRDTHYEVCILSIAYSWGVYNSFATVKHVSSVEIIRVDDGRLNEEIFNKSMALNMGIEKANGNVIMFLDCDMIVGEMFFRDLALSLLGHNHICFRVYYLGKELTGKVLSQPLSMYSYIAACEGSLKRGYEAYLDIDRDVKIVQERHKANPWGNSQFAIKRELLGDLRYDENFEGRGYQDLDFLLKLHKLRGNKRYPYIITSRDACLYHLDHSYEPTWVNESIEKANLKRYRKHQTGVVQ